MCKIIAFTNATKLKPQTTAKKISRILGKSQRDGFGYAFQTANGVFGERSLAPNSFTSRFGLDFKALPWTNTTQESFGVKGDVTGSAIFHGRTSTNQVNLVNTHPLQKHGWTLIHNGVVTNMGENYAMQTTNDSEHVLHHLANGGIDAVAKNLRGYYAVAALDPNGALHIIKDSTANLYSGYIKKLDSFVFGTTLDILQELERDLKVSRTAFEPVKNNTYLVFDQNKLVHQSTFEPLGYGRTESAWASNSLGYSLNDIKYSDELDSDEEKFWNEIDAMDASYTITDAYGSPMSLDDFQMLKASEQAWCVIRRGDGTILSLDKYSEDRI